MEKKKKSNEKELEAMISKLIKSLGDKKALDKSNMTIDNLIANISEKITPALKAKVDPTTLIDKDKFKSFVDILGDWIMNNFSSSKLIPLLSLVSLFFNLFGHNIEISPKELQSLMTCDTLDQLTDKKEEEYSKEQILYPDTILTDKFLNAIYSLVFTISNKPDIIIKSKNLIKFAIIISAQIVEIDNVATFFKKRRLIHALSNILKELKSNMNDPNIKASLIYTTKVVLSIFSKIGIKRPVYRDYMFKKSIPDKIIDIFISIYQSDKELITYFAYYTVFCTRTGDHKSFFWTKGVTGIFCDVILKEKDEHLLEMACLALWVLTKDSEEVQEDLKEQNYLDIAKELVKNYSKNNNIVFCTISTLRRIRDDEFYAKMSQELLYTFFALFDYYYIGTKNEFEELKKRCKENEAIAELGKEIKITILKELVAVLGNIAKYDEHVPQFLNKNLHIIFVDLKLSFVMFPKVIKNVIGAMINLTADNGVRDGLCKVPAFFQSVNNIFENYKDNKYIIDYELRLLLNFLKNEIAVNAMIKGNIFLYLMLFLSSFKQVPEIIFNTIQILRFLIVKKKGLEEFLTKLVDYYSGIFEFKPDDISMAYKYFVEDMIKFLGIPDQTNEFLSLKIEIINLFAYISNQDEEFKSFIEKSTELINILSQLIKNSNDGEDNKQLSLAIAQLPIEDLKFAY